MIMLMMMIMTKAIKKTEGSAQHTGPDITLLGEQ
jgi:hypothetical protein